MGYRSVETKQSIQTPYEKNVRKKAVVKPWYQRIRWKKVALTLFALYVALNLVGGLFSIIDLKQQQAVVDEQLNQASMQQQQWQEKIDTMNTEEAIERAAREKLGLIKPGEILIVRAGEN